MTKKGLIADSLLKTTQMTANQIGQIAGISERQVRHIKRKNLISESQTLHDTAFRSIKKICRGEVFGTIKEVKAADSIAAAREILSRTEPILKEEPQPTGVILNISFGRREEKPGMEINITPQSGEELANTEAIDSDK